MTQKERVMILNPVFTGYDAPLDSKIQKPQKYGITYTRKARDLLGGVKQSKQPIYYLSVRMDKGKEAALREALGDKEPCDAAREWIERVIKRSKKAAPTAPPVETASLEKS